MNKRMLDLMDEHGFSPDNDLVDFAEIVVRECAAVVEAKKGLCGSGIPDRVLLDMTIKDMFAYTGVDPKGP